MVYAGHFGPYVNCNEILFKFLSIEVSASQVYRVTDDYGKQIGKTTDFTERALIPVRNDEYLYVEVDGVMVLTRNEKAKHTGKEEEKKEIKELEKAEIKEVIEDGVSTEVIKDNTKVAPNKHSCECIPLGKEDLADWKEIKVGRLFKSSDCCHPD